MDVGLRVQCVFQGLVLGVYGLGFAVFREGSTLNFTSTLGPGCPSFFL